MTTIKCARCNKEVLPICPGCLAEVARIAEDLDQLGEHIPPTMQAVLEHVGIRQRSDPIELLARLMEAKADQNLQDGKQLYPHSLPPFVVERAETWRAAAKLVRTLKKEGHTPE